MNLHGGRVKIRGKVGEGSLRDGEGLERTGCVYAPSRPSEQYLMRTGRYNA